MKDLIVGLDPGPNKTGYVIINTNRELIKHGHSDITDLISYILPNYIDRINLVSIEIIKSRYQRISQDTIYTNFIAGRFYQHFDSIGVDIFTCYPEDHKRYLCGRPNANDKNIREKLLELGFSKSEVGRIGSHARAALSTALYGLNYFEK